jgi:hypothetical protein
MAKKKYKIDVHNPHYFGKRFGVHIAHGVGEGELEHFEVNEMRSWGYTVEEIVEKKPAPKKAPTKKKETEK